MGKLQLPDLDVFPGHFVGAGAFFDSVDLKADEAFGVGLELLLVGEVGDLGSVDPCLDAGAFGKDAVGIPLAGLKVLVGFELALGGHPTAGSFAVDVAGFAAGFDFDLGAIDPAGKGIAGLGADLDAGVELVIHLDFKKEFEVAVFLVGAEEGVGASFIGLANDGAVFHPVSGGTIALCPSTKGIPVEDGCEFFCSLGLDGCSQGEGGDEDSFHRL